MPSRALPGSEFIGELRAEPGIRALTDEAKIRAFLEALGRTARESTNMYLVAGATAVLHGWRSTTIDLDMRCPRNGMRSFVPCRS